MLKGFINITSDAKMCFEFSQSTPNTKIISLDDDDTYAELSPVSNPNVIKGTILLPPIEVQWAELDGDIQQFNALYFAHMNSKNVMDFIYTLIGYMYMGGNLIVYYPDFDASGLDNTASIQFLLEYLESGFGLHLGTGPNDPFRFDPNCIPMYYIGIYNLNIIDGYSFLMNYPVGAIISDEVYAKLIFDINIYGNNLNEKIEYLNILRGSLSKTRKKKAVLHNVK